MDPINLILSALLTGAIAGAQHTASEAIKDAYQGLKILIQNKIKGKPEAELIFSKYEEKLETWEKPLRELLVEIEVDKDSEVIGAAKKMLTLIKSDKALSGKFNVQIKGNVQGFVQGDKTQVTMQFDNQNSKVIKKKPRKKK